MPDEINVTDAVLDERLRRIERIVEMHDRLLRGNNGDPSIPEQIREIKRGFAEMRKLLYQVGGAVVTAVVVDVFMHLLP